jgi:hypothetical protein
VLGLDVLCGAFTAICLYLRWKDWPRNYSMGKQRYTSEVHFWDAADELVGE